MDAKLVVVGGEARVTEVQLNLPVTIGRGRSAGLTLPHPLVSRQHCEIYEEDGKLVVNDMGSLNGTFVGDQRIGEPTFLMPGELLTVGTVTFRAVYNLSDQEQGVNDESTGTDVSAKVSPSANTVQLDKTTSDLTDEADDLTDEADDIVEVEELDEVHFAEEEADADDVVEVADLEQVVDDDEILEVLPVEEQDVEAEEPEVMLANTQTAPPDEAPKVEVVAEVDEVEEVEAAEDIAEAEDAAESAPKPANHKPAAREKKVQDRIDTEAADYDTKEVAPKSDASVAEDEDDDLQAFLRGLG